MQTQDETLFGDRPMPAEDFLPFGVSITQALADLHKNGQTHGDICPDNIEQRQGKLKLRFAEPDTDKIELAG